MLSTHKKHAGKNVKSGRACFYVPELSAAQATCGDSEAMELRCTEVSQATSRANTRRSLASPAFTKCSRVTTEPLESNETTVEETSRTTGEGSGSTSAASGREQQKQQRQWSLRNRIVQFFARNGTNLFTSVMVASAILLLFPLCLLYYTAGTIAASMPKQAHPGIGNDTSARRYAVPTCVDYHPLLSSGPAYAELAFQDPDDFLPYKTKVISNNAIFCVYQNDVFMRFPKLRYRVVDVPGAYCTHILYYKAGVTADGSLYSKDPVFDETYQGYRSATELKIVYPHLKVLLAVGGGPDARDTFQFSSFTSDLNRTRFFADKAYWWLVNRGFDGLHLDWRQPGGQCGSKSDKRNFLSLAQILRERFGVRFLLTITVPYQDERRHTGYHLPGLADQVDYLLAITHGFHNASSRNTHCPSPYAAPPNASGPTIRDVMHTLKYEVPREHRQRLCFSVSLRGIFWTLKSSNSFGVGSPAIRAGPPVGESHTRGIVEYPLICKYLLKDSLDTIGLCNYAVRFRNWVGYEGTKSLPFKLSRMRRDMGTPGLCLTVWDLEFDDFMGDCGESRSPLLRTIFLALAT